MKYLILSILFAANCFALPGNPGVYNSTVLLSNRDKIPRHTERVIMAIAARNVEKMTGWRFTPFADYRVKGAKNLTVNQALWMERALSFSGQLGNPTMNNFMVWLMPPANEVQGYWLDDNGWGNGNIAVTQDAHDPMNTVLKLTKAMINLLWAQGSL